MHVWSKLVRKGCWVCNSLYISNSAPAFWIQSSSSTYEFEIDLGLTQILNSTTGDRVWPTRHIENEFKMPQSNSKCIVLI